MLGWAEISRLISRHNFRKAFAGAICCTGVAKKSGFVVQCQNDRSQHRNKAEAMAMLKARLYDLEIKKQNEEIDKENAAKTDISWGHQIRSYVLQPYQMVKDLRTEYETSDSNGVLDGNLGKFVSAALAQKAAKY